MLYDAFGGEEHWRCLSSASRKKTITSTTSFSFIFFETKQKSRMHYTSFLFLVNQTDSKKKKENTVHIGSRPLSWKPNRAEEER